MKISFKGGVHLPENKHLCKDLRIKELPVPEIAYFPLQQSTGSPAEPVVKKGDLVKRGTCIARAAGFISSNVHSSISG
ncbi:MAG: electron transport complex subunit RsxC, partial [Candidatus Auribacterota bacterium]|nr:electron transport complex subunit RsxC [Candidatus Auribacterota bacterium]